MLHSKFRLCLVATLLALAVNATPVQAQASRTWVSGVGNDANPCSRTAPCQTFAGAFGKTAVGGEINVLDPGGFGGVTITQSISIYNDGVGVAGVLVSLSDALTISGANTVVNIRGIVIDGGGAGRIGINLADGAQLNVENCVIQGFGVGIVVGTGSSNTQVHVQDTVIKNNTGNAIGVHPNGAFSTNVTLSRVQLVNNGGDGLRVDARDGTGSVTVGVSDSIISENGGSGVNNISGGSNGQVTTVDIMRTAIANNAGVGVQSLQVAGLAIVAIGSSQLLMNGTATSSVLGGSVLTYGTNQLLGALGTGFTGTRSPL
jgi:hypothetical protein